MIYIKSPFWLTIASVANLYAVLMKNTLLVSGRLVPSEHRCLFPFKTKSSYSRFRSSSSVISTSSLLTSSTFILFVTENSQLYKYRNFCGIALPI